MFFFCISRGEENVYYAITFSLIFIYLKRIYFAYIFIENKVMTEYIYALKKNEKVIIIKRSQVCLPSQLANRKS